MFIKGVTHGTCHPVFNFFFFLLCHKVLDKDQSSEEGFDLGSQFEGAQSIAVGRTPRRALQAGGHIVPGQEAERKEGWCQGPFSLSFLEMVFF